ncbi:valine--tRNA ligase [Candidatus Microgenomates bacterium]|nr:valine--tRNA ligase [Candidatus Microgenomates bacterium]
MDSKYDHKAVEGKTYQMWESGGHFTPKIPARNASHSDAGGDLRKKPFTIILPLPNANDPMHMGHCLFTVEDIMVRYHRMKGEPTLWLPGGDHAGIETQFVFEKHLAKEGKSRFDFDRDTLYQMVWDFAEKNKDLNKDQMKRLGFSLDWTRYHYSLEPQIVEMVLDTFRKLFKDQLVYRGEKMVNYCTRCGTAFSELEVDYQEKQDFLYYLDYGPISIATTRPETIFADVAVAISPSDKKHKALMGKNAIVPLINVKVPIITADGIDANFGTGALKVTPGYAPEDFEIGQKNNLETIIVINRQGRMVAHPRVPQELVGLNIKQAREKTIELLKAAGKLLKEEPITHSVGTCYKCKNTIEPMVIPQWFVKIKPLVDPAVKAVKDGETKIFPKKRFEKHYFDWMDKLHDWNISRSIVWGPRIPVWYCLDCNPNIVVNKIDGGVQNIIAEKDATYQLENDVCNKCHGKNLIQETDTFDTWFLSGQWPVNTLKCNPGDFEYFYPTSVLDTMWDILNAWVSRMMMLGIYLTGKAPFAVAHMHARVVDKLGQKMSKSKGNVMDPIPMIDLYGADALRLALTIGIAPAADIAISEEKIRGMRNFTNKLWNIARFILETENKNKTGEKDQELLKKVNSLIKSTTKNIDTYKFGQASDDLYQFTWHEFADVYLEDYKKGLISYSTLNLILETLLKLWHPFIPYVTEEIWSLLPNNSTPLIISPWPSV